MILKPVINTAITGNGRILAAYDSKGQLHRLFWPSIDFAQHIAETWAALLGGFSGEKAVRLDDEKIWHYSQDYVDDTNILRTIATYNHEVMVNTLDFVVPDRDVLVRTYEVNNTSDKPFPCQMLYYASVHFDNSPFYNSTFYDSGCEAMIHYRHGKWLAVAGGRGPDAFQCGCSEEQAINGILGGHSVSMADAASQKWNLGVINPGQTVVLTIYLALGSSKEQVAGHVAYARSLGQEGLLKGTARFWEDYLSRGLGSGLSLGEEHKGLFKTSVMVCKLLMNADTGGIIAAPEFDEAFRYCGGYAYCWGRDATFTAHAMLKAGYPDYAGKFYRWAAVHQNPEGGWPQRQYTDGSLAPRWGDQIDETGTILWGMCQYYKETWDKEFLEETWTAVIRGADYLISFLDAETGLPAMSLDLWEERLGQHAYSAAAVYAGLKGAGQIAKALGEGELAIKWLETSMVLKAKILKHFWDKTAERFMRSVDICTDDRPDASLLGLTVPFGVFEPIDPKMRKTVEDLIQKLGVPQTGGFKRYLGDTYAGGNPWVIITLWLGMFECSAGNLDRAKELLDGVLRWKTPLGLLPEQVNPQTGEAAWVLPLAWSHAMYILLVNLIEES